MVLPSTAVIIYVLLLQNRWYRPSLVMSDGKSPSKADVQLNNK